LVSHFDNLDARPFERIQVDIRELDRRALAATGKIVAGLTDDQLDAATPCTEWRVRDVIEHMVGNADHYITTVTGTTASPAGDDPRERFRISGEHLTSAFAPDAALQTLIPLGKFGTYPGKIALRVHFVDVLVHGWDIGRAIGMDVELAEELAAPALRIAASIPDTPEIRGHGASFAPRQPVGATAPTGLRLVAELGRSPAWPG
jgi:uncharacterized protein (TIGR03086 family)